MVDWTALADKLNLLWKLPRLLTAVLLTLALSWTFQSLWPKPRLEAGEVGVIFLITYALVCAVWWAVGRLRKLVLGPTGPDHEAKP